MIWSCYVKKICRIDKRDKYDCTGQATLRQIMLNNGFTKSFPVGFTHLFRQMKFLKSQYLNRIYLKVLCNILTCICRLINIHVFHSLRQKLLILYHNIALRKSIVTQKYKEFQLFLTSYCFDNNVFRVLCNLCILSMWPLL